jgi:hypothetical protein
LDYKALIDTKNFIEDYHPVKFSTPDCQYEWEIFREAEELLTKDNWFSFSISHFEKNSPNKQDRFTKEINYPKPATLHSPSLLDLYYCAIKTVELRYLAYVLFEIKSDQPL